MSTLWKSTRPLHPRFQSLQNCLTEDWFLLPYEIELQRAHARVLQEAGILEDEELSGLLRALDEITDAWQGKPAPASDCEDLHTWIEDELTSRCGDSGRKIHTARSRNDQVATLLKLYARDAGRGLASAVGALGAKLCEKAVTWADLAFPLQTHTQFAAPGTVGFWALRYASSLARVLRHLEFLVEDWRRECPLGSGAVAGSSIPIDRNRQAELLGFEGPGPNALDATSTRDETIQLLSVASQCALHLQSFATDVLLFSQTLTGWTAYPADFATGSSMMPNKSNPDFLELLRGEANALHGAPGQATVLLKGLPSGYNRDLQCLKPLLHDTVNLWAELLELTTAFVEVLEFHPERLEASLRQGDVTATLRMEQRVLRGETLRSAHHAEADGGESVDRPETLYRTTGSASPDETTRAAKELGQKFTRE